MASSHQQLDLKIILLFLLMVLFRNLELVLKSLGSRIIFNEIPRVGSTFVAFSYVGSEADVDAAVVVPPIEAGDLIEIQGEVSDREVAVIESSNSLVTFDYLGSVFGKDAPSCYRNYFWHNPKCIRHITWIWLYIQTDC